MTFVRDALQPNARVSDDQLRAVQAAGYSDAQITETLLTIAQTVFTNLFNRVHQTTLDFPPAANFATAPRGVDFEHCPPVFE